MSDWLVTDDEWIDLDEEPIDLTDAEPSKRTVLVVDDDPSVRSMLTFLFEDEGFEVKTANDGSEALVVLRVNPPDLMILDLMMPVLDGHGVLRERAQKNLAPDTRVVMLTAKSDPKDVVWCWEAGADEFLNKPVDPEALLHEAEVLLRRSPEELGHRREEGLADARRLDVMEAAFDGGGSRRRRK